MKYLSQKILGPILGQLKQGVTPEKLAQSISCGLVIGTMPIFGITTSTCAIAAFFFKLNHIAIQAINFAANPLQLLLIIPFVRMGEWMFNKSPTPLNLVVIMEQFKNNFKLAFVKYLYLGLLGLSAWILIAPFAFFLIYGISKFLLTSVLRKGSDSTI